MRRINYRKAIDSARAYVKATGGNFTERPEAALAGIDEIENFYLLRPHYTRCIIAIVAAGLTLLVCGSGSLLGEIASKKLSYILFIFQIIISEVTIQYWRVLRDRELRILREKLEYQASISEFST